MLSRPALPDSRSENAPAYADDAFPKAPVVALTTEFVVAAVASNQSQKKASAFGGDPKSKKPLPPSRRFFARRQNF